MKRCWRRCAARSCRRSTHTARCVTGSSMRPAWPRRASTRSAWPGSTVASWARSRAARSWSACRLPTMWRRCRSRRGSICPRPGATMRRGAVGVPLDVAFQTKPAIALDLIGRALADGAPPGVVPGDEVYGSTAGFRRGVAGLGLDYAVAVRSTITVLPPEDGRRARLWRERDGLLSVRALAARIPRSAWRWITWREGSGPELTGRFAKVRVAVEHEGEQTLLVEWPTGDRDPVGYWLVMLPPQTPIKAMVAAAKGRWWVEQGYRDLKQEVGLGDYEGRGWRGFHHHVTLCFAAYGFLVLR